MNRCPLCNAPVGTHHAGPHGRDAWSTDPATRILELLAADQAETYEAVAA